MNTQQQENLNFGDRDARTHCRLFRFGFALPVLVAPRFRAALRPPFRALPLPETWLGRLSNRSFRRPFRSARWSRLLINRATQAGK